jgi:hypothetical protein
MINFNKGKNKQSLGRLGLGYKSSSKVSTSEVLSFVATTIEPN